MVEYFNLFCFFLHRNVSAPFLYPLNISEYREVLCPLKTFENRKPFWCFQGVEKGCSGNKWVKIKSLRRQKSLKNHTFRWNLVPLRSIVAIPPKQITSPHKNGLPNAVFASVAKVLSVVNNFKPWTSSLTFLYIEYISLLLFLSFSWSAKI